MRRLFVLGVCVASMMLGGSAAADSKSAQVFPLASSGLPDNLTGTPAKLTKALASAIGGEVASVPLEDAAGLLECDPESSTCLAAVAKSLAAERLVFGAISVDKGKVKVTLTRFDVGPDRQQQTFLLSGSNADALAKDLVRSSAPLFGNEAPEIIVDEPDPPPDKPEPILAPIPGKITTSTWAMIGGGAVLAASGVVLLVSAQSIKRDVENAPNETLEDIQRLRALENVGVQRTIIGNVLLIGGGVALAAGVVRAIIQRKSVTEPPLVQPAAVEGGAVLVFTVIR